MIVTDLTVHVMSNIYLGQTAYITMEMVALTRKVTNVIHYVRYVSGQNLSFYSVDFCFHFQIFAYDLAKLKNN